jgi:GNAT superfamily N-acetyltransferase
MTPARLAPLTYRPATAADVPACLDLRGRTRENAVSADRLAAMGITVESWRSDVRRGLLPGYVCTDGDSIVGYCFGEVGTGEVAVLALLPDHEGKGIGRRLLGLMVEHLARAGHARLFLGCSADPRTRSHGFYRHLGWRPTGRADANGDEVLELFPAAT